MLQIFQIAQSKHSSLLQIPLQLANMLRFIPHSADTYIDNTEGRYGVGGHVDHCEPLAPGHVLLQPHLIKTLETRQTSARTTQLGQHS